MKVLGSRVDVKKAYSKLPSEAKLSLDTILSDDDNKLEDVSIQYLIKEVKWVIYKLGMDIGEASGSVEEKYYAKQSRKCNSWLNYYSKYDFDRGKPYHETRDRDEYLKGGNING